MRKSSHVILLTGSCCSPTCDFSVGNGSDRMCCVQRCNGAIGRRDGRVLPEGDDDDGDGLVERLDARVEV